MTSMTSMMSMGRRSTWASCRHAFRRARVVRVRLATSRSSWARDFLAPRTSRAATSWYLAGSR